MVEKELQDIANLLRRDALSMISAAGSGHATSCLSCAEIMSVLFFHHMAYEQGNSKNPENDEFILSKGHAAAIYYAALKRAGCISQELLDYRKFTSPLEGHPMPLSGWIKVASGSLGQGLSVGLGMALSAKLQKRNFRTYVLLGDSEVSEGEIYEALQLASFYRLNNLCAIIDVNRLGQRGETMPGWNLQEYQQRFSSFGWKTISIDGHNISQLILALKQAKDSILPTVILAKTVKGKGVSFLEDQLNYHGKALKKDEMQKALKEIPNSKMPGFLHPISDKAARNSYRSKKAKAVKYKVNALVSTREAYGRALANLALADQKVLSADAEVSNSTFSEEVKKKTPCQFVEAYIAEQNLISMALGLSLKGYNVFASTFSAFLSRAHDQIRMASLSRANFTIVGSHAGISIGQDGASQMGLEDIAIFRDLPESIIYYPADAVSAEKLTFQSSAQKGIKYIRTSREKMPVIYKTNERFIEGDFKVLKEGKKDEVVLAGAGITLHESLKACDILKGKGISAAVVDLYCIRPFNGKKFADFIRKHGGALVVAEDHYEAGGIGEMIIHQLLNSGIKIKTLAVTKMPHSGMPEELLEKYGINGKHIALEAKGLIRQ